MDTSDSTWRLQIEKRGEERRDISGGINFYAILTQIPAKLHNTYTLIYFGQIYRNRETEGQLLALQ